MAEREGLYTLLALKVVEEAMRQGCRQIEETRKWVLPWSLQR
jgi:hypothetical protein